MELALFTILSPHHATGLNKIVALAMEISPVFHVLLDRAELQPTCGAVGLSVSSEEVPLAVLKPDIAVPAD